jgi:membrane protein YqaA with SNARE-associated domain
MTAYLLLFGVAFAAATILPLSSELLLIAQLHAGGNPSLLWLFATAGNTLGALVNWALGRWLIQHVDKPWFPTDRKALARAQAWFLRYGQWTLLMSWVPIGGDALTLVAGMMKMPLLRFSLLVATGKGLRYALIIGGAGLLT